MKDFLKRNPAVKEVGWVYNQDNSVAIMHLTRKDGSSERYNLEDEKERADAEKKYGSLPIMPPADLPLSPAFPAAPVTPASPVPSRDASILRVSDDFEITNEKARITLRNGKTEYYDLTNAKEKKEFESRYGRIITPATPADVTAPVVVLGRGEGLTSTTIAPAKVAATTGVGLTAAVTPRPRAGGVTSTTPMLALAPSVAGGVAVIDDEGYAITGNEDIVVKITKNSKRQELDAIIQQMKAKGIRLSYDEIEYNEKGQLVVLTGTMSSGDGSKSRFVASDFEMLILAMIKKSDRTIFKVSTRDSKEVI
jgi:hypothetical protein